MKPGDLAINQAAGWKGGLNVRFRACYTLPRVRMNRPIGHSLAFSTALSSFHLENNQIMNKVPLE